MKSTLTIALTLIASLAFSTAVFAGPADSFSTASAAPSFGASAFAGFTQQKGARPASAVSGAVSAKLLNEYGKPAAHSTGIKPDTKGLSGFIAPAAPKVAGMVGQKVNTALLTGLVSAPKK